MVFRDISKDGTVRLTGSPGGGGGGEPGEPGDPGPPGAPGSDGIELVYHGSDGSVTRPTANVVYWLGPAYPVNSIDGDWWREA
jgi:hypothetical protein